MDLGEGDGRMMGVRWGCGPVSSNSSSDCVGPASCPPAGAPPEVVGLRGVLELRLSSPPSSGRESSSSNSSVMGGLACRDLL